MNSIFKKYVGTKAFYMAALSVAIPIMVQNGITNFVNMLDNIMVGIVGTEQMTGVSIVNQLIFVFNLALFGAVSGVGIFTAQYHGSKNREGVRNTFRFKLIVGLIISAVGIIIFLLGGDYLISLYLQGEGTPEQIVISANCAKEYLMIMLIGFVPFAVTSSYAGTLRETGETLFPMIAGIIAVCVNLAFNAVLIYGLLGFPAFGVVGAAIATVISRFVEAVVIIWWTHRHKEKNRFIEGAFRNFRIPLSLVFSMTKKAIPLMLNETLWAGGIAILTQCYSTRGFDVVAAVNIVAAISNVFNVTFIAMGNAIGIISGQMLGAGKVDEVVDSNRKLIFFTVVSCSVVGLVLAAISPFFPLLYNTTTDIRSLATKLILVVAISTPINALANACYFTLRSGGKTVITVLFDSCYVWVVSVPVAFVLSRYTSISIVPLYFICHIIDIIKCILGLIMIKKGVWINNIVSQEKTEAE